MLHFEYKYQQIFLQEEFQDDQQNVNNTDVGDDVYNEHNW
jgi:hypothetical protein